MFCPECGCNIGNETVNFCPECGEKLTDCVATESPANPVEQPQAPSPCEADKVSYDVYGVVFTNVSLLAKKLDTSASTLTTEISRFIKGKAAAGVKYELVDVGNYKFRTTKKQVALKGRESIGQYLEILKDVYDDEVSKGNKKTKYLFILGSSDIIPMSTIPHYKRSSNFSDKDIDTDILYGYPYKEDVLALLQSEKIFGYHQLYMVGRLPVGEDIAMSDFTRYLERAVKHSNGIPMTSAYSQCDPHWKKVTEQVTKEASLKDWLRNLDGKYKDEIYFNRLMLTPYVDTTNVEKLFNDKASIYYYNLHGSAARGSSGYVGEYPPYQRKYATGITPRLMRKCMAPNVVVTESCYGARHIGMKADESMVLSSIYGNTLAFLGSSRIAWGKIDSNQCDGAISTSLADTMAYVFLNAMLAGERSGISLLRARQGVFKLNNASEERAATLVEFNLFGDPTLAFDTAKGKRAEASQHNITTSSWESGKYHVEKLSEKDGGVMNSILNLVRREVDQALAEIQLQVSNHLYKHYGLPPRPASVVYRITSPDGSKVLQFDYVETTAEGITGHYSAVTTEQGDVLDVISSK